MAKNPWLRARIPRLPFAQRAVRRFMPGEGPDSALAASRAFAGEGIGSLFTRLGENLTDLHEAEAVADHYLELIDRLQVEHLEGEVSLKLTQLGFDLDPDRAKVHAARLADRAAVTGAWLWLDMEGSAYTEATVALYERLKSDHPNVGLCLQAYLRRTAADVQRLLPLEPAIRLVKGAYAESAAVAYQTRREVDTNYVALTVAMMEAKARGRAVRIGLGTHDVTLIRQLAEHARALGLGLDAFEVQMLYGIRVDEQRRLAAEGFPVKDLIAYGPAWYAWYMRRLAERPANVMFALRQLLP